MPSSLSRRLVIGTAGHIDHGKSALVRALTGIDPDRLKEEQTRGITIDLGFAHAAIDGVEVAFVDVPGHERFVRNMLAGAGGIDAVLLVVAADESVMPQTREHFEICRLIGVSRGVVVLTKCDLADADLRAVAASEARALVAGSVLADAPIVEVSSRTGEGLDALRHAIAALAREPDPARADGAVRLPVDRAFTMRGFGTVVTGTLVSGRVAIDAELATLPAGGRVRVRGVQVHGAAVGEATAPSRVALNLAGASVDDVPRGVTLASPDAFVVTRRADVHLELLAGVTALKHGSRVRIFHGTADTSARAAIAAVRRSADEVWTPAAAGLAGAVPAGGESFARLRFEHPMVFARGDRFVIRLASPATTIGGGVVLDPQPPPAGLRRPTSLERFARLDIGRGHEKDALTHCARQWIVESGLRGVSSLELAARAGVRASEATRAIDALARAGQVRIVAQRAFAVPAVEQVVRRLLDALGAFHAALPDEPGMPAETAREQAAPRAPHALFDHVVESLVGEGRVAGSDRLRLTSHQVVSSAEQARVADAVEAHVRAAGLAAPDVSGLGDALRAPTAEVDRAVRLLVRDGKLVKLGTLVFHQDALEQLKLAIRALRPVAPSDPPVALDVATFKARFGLTRKHAIPLLEWLDRQRVTRRVGEGRVVL